MNTQVFEVGVFLLGGLALLGVGYWLSDWVKRRVFNRTNAHGVQVFENYGKKKGAHAGEGCVLMLSRLLSGVGCLVVLSGLFILIILYLTAEMSSEATPDEQSEAVEIESDIVDTAQDK